MVSQAPASGGQSPNFATSFDEQNAAWLADLEERLTQFERHEDTTCAPKLALNELVVLVAAFVVIPVALAFIAWILR